MSIEVWGLMPKSQIDEETVEQAILRLIAVHEADPTAHMGENEAIEAHRKSEVIDHLASSVFDDKLAYDRNSVNLNFENFDLYNHGSNVEYIAINSLYLYSSNSSNPQYFYANTQDMWSGSEFLYSKNPRFFSKIMLSSITSQNTYFVVGERDEGRGFGFKIINGTLSAIYYKSDFSEVAQTIKNLSAYVIYKIECRVVNGTDLQIWINNVLEGTITNCDFPTTNNYGWGLPWVDFKSTTTTSKALYIRDFYWEADL